VFNKNLLVLAAVCSLANTSYAMKQEFNNALFRGDITTVDKFLADKNFDVNAHDKQGWTPLFNMCATRNVAMTKHLLKFPRVNIKIHNDKVKTAYHALLLTAEHSSAEEFEKECAVIRAIRCTEEERKTASVINEVNCSNGYNTPLDLVVKHKYSLATIRCLLVCGAQVQRMCDSSHTLEEFWKRKKYEEHEEIPLFELIGQQQRYTRFMQSIKNKMHNQYIEETVTEYPGIIKQWTNHQNDSCAHFAVSYGNREAVRIFLKHGVNFTAHRNDDGQSALDIAHKRKDLKDIAELIENSLSIEMQEK
jgi:hypothetical protein